MQKPKLPDAFGESFYISQILTNSIFINFNVSYWTKHGGHEILLRLVCERKNIARSAWDTYIQTNLGYRRRVRKRTERAISDDATAYDLLAMN